MFRVTSDRRRKLRWLAIIPAAFGGSLVAAAPFNYFGALLDGAIMLAPTVRLLTGVLGPDPMNGLLGSLAAPVGFVCVGAWVAPARRMTFAWVLTCLWLVMFWITQFNLRASPAAIAVDLVATLLGLSAAMVVSSRYIAGYPTALERDRKRFGELAAYFNPDGPGLRAPTKSRLWQLMVGAIFGYAFMLWLFASALLDPYAHKDFAELAEPLMLFELLGLWSASLAFAEFRLQQKIAYVAALLAIGTIGSIGVRGTDLLLFFFLSLVPKAFSVRATTLDWRTHLVLYVLTLFGIGIGGAVLFPGVFPMPKDTLYLSWGTVYFAALLANELRWLRH